jgi:hypothetical protein
LVALPSATLLLVSLSCTPAVPDEERLSEGFPILTGEYLGQPLPGEEPELFAPGIVSPGIYTRDVAMTPDGSQIFFGVLFGSVSAIIETHRGVDGVWSEPEVAPFSRDSRFFNLEPHVSPDGSRLLFLSTRVDNPGPEDLRNWSNQDIWVVDRTDDGWGEPYNLGAPVNSEESEYFPSMTMDGTIYFTRGFTDGQGSFIYRSRLVEGRYLEPERLGPEVNSTQNQFNAFIAPDESYLIISTASREDTMGGADYYVVFRDETDQWSEPIHFGEPVNTPMNTEMSPYVSPDGRFFFFMSARPFPLETLPDTLTWTYLKSFREMPETGNPGIYWMRADFIEGLRPEGF